ncbi:MAG TPA: TldD/PmbA family protein [Burkholderiaceae bacterium]|nr:TldD/PmbA family protein [Burkholderiaceae bacterium]
MADTLAAPTGAAYAETRRHELRKSRMLMIDGNLAVNTRNAEAGVSARVYRDGYWGFASAPGAAKLADVTDMALRNAAAMSRFGSKQPLMLAGGSHRGEHMFHGRAALTQQETMDRLAALHTWCAQHYPRLRSTRFVLSDEHHTKTIETSSGSAVTNSIQRAFCYITFVAQADDGSPVELTEYVSAKGSLADLPLTTEELASRLERLYGHVQAKRHAVPARGGLHTVVMAPELAGMLAHEAMGHPCEADLVLGGAVTRDLVGQRVASDLITMVDVAHSFQGKEAMIPVYADDEGTPASDAVLIDRGILTGFMSSRETAARLGIAATGNARAYAPHDEPLVRMRNTVIVPGMSKLEEMIAGVDNGYLLMQTGNGEADSTTEFMFGLSLAYEIKNGKLGRAVRDTTISGSAIKVLQSVDAVSDDLHWNCSGYCGKKQPMVVSSGGPALRACAHVGGQ